MPLGKVLLMLISCVNSYFLRSHGIRVPIIMPLGKVLLMLISCVNSYFLRSHGIRVPIIMPLDKVLLMLISCVKVYFLRSHARRVKSSLCSFHDWCFPNFFSIKKFWNKDAKKSAREYLTMG